MITIILCENFRDVQEVIRNPYSVISETILPDGIDKLNKHITTAEGNQYFLIHEPNHLLSIEAHTWTMTSNCRYRKDLETLIKTAVWRCRLPIKEIK